MHNFVVQVWRREAFHLNSFSPQMKTRLTDSISASLVYGLWHSLRIPEDGYKNCTKTYSSWRISSVATECLDIRAVPLRCMSTDRFNSSPELENANNSPSKQRRRVELEVQARTKART